jgi:hypothetical protein
LSPTSRFFDGGCRDKKKPVPVAGFFVGGI